MNKRYAIGVLGIASLFFVGGFAYAAYEIPGINDAAQSITINLSSETPEPFTNITVRAESVRYDLKRARISWLVNGKQTSSGIGDASVDFKTGDAGTVTNVQMIADVPSAGAIEQSITVIPASVDLLWRANVYVPPFYRGKALASSAAELTVVAMPNISRQGKKIRPKELVYNWKLGENVLSSQSGYGKDSITVTGARIYSGTEVSLEVSTLDGSIIAKKILLIPSVDPKVVFYENRPLEGVRYERALSGEISLSEPEVVVRAEPYFFSNFGTLNYEWLFNHKPLDVAREKWNDLVLRQEGGANGTAKIDLSVQSGDTLRGRILQNAAAALLVSFGAQNSGTGAFFGQ